MSGPHTSVNVQISWEAVVTALQLPVAGKALPQRTRCPICRQEALHLFHDTSQGGAWHACKSCGSTGDMIELAAAAWQVPLEAALHQLAAEGVPIPAECLQPAAVASYGQETAGRRQRFNALWNTAKADYALWMSSPILRRLRATHNLLFDGTKDRWLAGPGQLVGASSHTAIEAVFHPGVIGVHRMQASCSATRLFKGSNWHEMMMVPFHTLPGRISALMFMGREGRPVDQVFRAFDRYTPDAGLAGLWSVDAAGDPRHVIVVDDWLLMLKIQFRVFNASMKPLPIVAWHDDGKCKTKSWAALSGKQLVFWSVAPNHRMIDQAVKADGMLSLIGPVDPRPDNVNQYLRFRPGRALERVIVENARPWPEALHRWLKRAEAGEVDALFSALEEAGSDVSYILRRCGNPRAIVSAAPTRRAVMVGEWRITEHDDIWRATKHTQSVDALNCTIKLVNTIKDKGTSETFFYGELRFRGRTLLFIERTECFATGAKIVTWLGAKMAEANLGVPVVYSKVKEAMPQIIHGFHAPTFIVDDLWRWVEKLQPK